MSSPRYPDDFSIPPQPESRPAGQPDDTGDALTMQPDYQQQVSQSTPPGTYPPAPGQYSPPVMPYYGPNSAPLPPGANPPPPGYSAPPSMPLPPSYGPTTTPLPGFGAPAPNSQFGLAAAFSMPMVEPTPNIRQGFLITGIGGGVAFLTYFVFGLPWSWPMWLVPVLAALVGVLGFVPSVRNRMYGPLTPRNGAMAAMVASGLGLLFLFFVWSRFGSLGFWIVALGLGAGIVGGVLVYRETQPASTAAFSMIPLHTTTGAPLAASNDPTELAGAAMPMSSPPSAIQTATASPQPAPKSARGGRAGTGEGKNLILGGILLVFDLIGGAWSLILQAALVILVIVGIVGFVKGCAASATLNEHSSCQDFQQASSDAQNKVLQDMLAAHHNSSDNITLVRASLNLYCNIYGGSAPIDGIYGSGTNIQLPARVLHVPASPLAFAHRGPAQPSAEA